MKKQVLIPLILIGVLSIVLLILVIPGLFGGSSDKKSQESSVESFSASEIVPVYPGGEAQVQEEASGDSEASPAKMPSANEEEDASETEEASEAEESENSSESSTTSEASETSAGSLPMDQQTEANTDFETEGDSFDDIMVKVLSALLSRDFETLSTYVSSSGLRLSPMGESMDEDVILSKEETASFLSSGSRTFGVFPGSGESIYMDPGSYYERFLCPTDFSFSSCTVTYDDPEDLMDAKREGVHTVRYTYEPNIMEWQDIVMVYCSEDGRDVLCGIIHRDMGSY